MKISIVGTGYVGLVTAVCFAEMGNDVYCVDRDLRRLKLLTAGKSPIYEPGLEQILDRNNKAGRLHYHEEIEDVINITDVCFIAVGTPSLQDGNVDMTSYWNVIDCIGATANRDLYVVNKSTVPVGTAETALLTLKNKLKQHNINNKIDVISNPEFLKEGDAINDFMKPDRVIIGSHEEASINFMRHLYSPFVHNSDRFIVMDPKSAEMAKYASNAMLATKISFMNELANLCEKTGADINKVRVGIGSDTRIGYSYIYPGCGYGGSCFPKDVRGLISFGTKSECSLRILKAVEETNNNQKKILVNKVLNLFGADLENYKIAVWGLSFKPETDDMREAPSVITIEELIKYGASVSAYDPKAIEEAKNKYFLKEDKLEFCDNKYDALNNADALLLITEWKEFKSPDFLEIKSRLKRPIIIDGRNQYDRKVMIEMGFQYLQIGVKNEQV